MMAPNYDYGVQTNYMLFLFFIFFIMFMLSIKSKNCSCSFWYFKYIWRKIEFWHARETSFLTYFGKCSSFVPPCERQKTLDLLLFPGGMKSKHWKEIGEIMIYLCYYLDNWKTVFIKEQLSLTASGFLMGIPMTGRYWRSNK